jgi:predicted dehydrogenase
MELGAVCDQDELRASEFGDKYNVNSYINFSEMMEREQVNLVSVLTHSGSHANIVIELSKFKKDIIVEKPISLTLEDSNNMIEACCQNGIRLFVVKQNRYNPPILELKKIITEGKLGKLNLGTIRLRWARDENYYKNELWRGTWEKDGGVLCNQAIHHLDLLQWMMGDIDTVSAIGATRMADIQAEDTAIVSIKFKSGALGVVEATTTTRPSNIEASVSILGTDGIVEIAGMSVNKVVHWKVRSNNEDESISRLNRENNIFGSSHIEFYKDVAKSIKDNVPPAIDGNEGMKSLKLVIAAYESIESGKTVHYDNFTPELCKLGKKI